MIAAFVVMSVRLYRIIAEVEGCRTSASTLEILHRSDCIDLQRFFARGLLRPGRKASMPEWRVVPGSLQQRGAVQCVSCPGSTVIALQA